MSTDRRFESVTIGDRTGFTRGLPLRFASGAPLANPAEAAAAYRRTADLHGAYVKSMPAFV